MGTKNNPKNREKTTKKITYNGKEVSPVKFYGSNRGLPNIIAAVYSGTNNVVFNKDNIPLTWQEIKDCSSNQV